MMGLCMLLFPSGRAAWAGSPAAAADVPAGIPADVPAANAPHAAPSLELLEFLGSFATRDGYEADSKDLDVVMEQPDAGAGVFRPRGQDQ